ncbi:glycosyltransferase family 2 protein [soil metagenome]
MNKSSPLQLSVIIVNYNVKYFLEQCLRSVVSACYNLTVEIIVIDNNSSDGSEQYFNAKFDKVTFIWNKENIGFGRANNLALKLATGDHILFLNPDTIIAEDCLEKCLAIFKNKPSTGALGVKMIDGGGNYLKESKRAFPSPLTSLFKLSGLCALFPHSGLFARYYLGNLDEKMNHEIDVVAGAFMMIPKTVLDNVGAFDEIFFMYGEDVDLSFRIQKAGLKNYYFSGTSIIHFKGESTKKGTLNYIRLFYGAMSLFVKKHYSGGFAGIYSLLMRIAIWIKALLSGISHLLKMSQFQKKKEIDNKACLVVADKTDYVLITKALLKENLQRIIIEESEIAPGEHFSIILMQVQSLVKMHNVKEIIFGSNGLSIKNMITLVEKLNIGISYKFHLAETGSIVGSENKEDAGIFIIID